MMTTTFSVTGFENNGTPVRKEYKSRAAACRLYDSLRERSPTYSAECAIIENYPNGTGKVLIGKGRDR